MSEKIVYLMRGLPGCGKSYTAKKLAGDTGVVCETDEYFYTQVGKDPKKYDYKKELMAEARRWNFGRFREAVDSGKTPVVVDRGTSLSVDSQIYARYAVERGCAVELKKPESPWWQELRVLLKYKQYNGPVLQVWAERLAAVSRVTHRVSESTIRRRMSSWKHDLTVEDILNFDPKKAETQRNKAAARRPKSVKAQEKGARSSGKKGEKVQQERPGLLTAARSWVGDFLLNQAEDEGTRNPNKDIRVAIKGDADND